jgi:hypothetical protein
MSPRGIRWVVVVVFVGGIAGMIVGSILDNNGIAISFGIVTAVAALCLMLVTSVAPPGSLARRRSPARHADAVDPEVAADVEARINDLVAGGADERAVRQLVRRAMDLGTGRAHASDVPARSEGPG